MDGNNTDQFKVDPAEFEKAILEKEKEIFNTANAEEVAAQLFYLYAPQFEHGISTLSKKALQRVIMKLVTYPLNDRAYKPQSEGENNVFLIGDRLLQSKYVMMVVSYLTNKELTDKMEEKVSEAYIVKEETKETVSG